MADSTKGRSNGLPQPHFRSALVISADTALVGLLVRYFKAFGSDVTTATTVGEADSAAAPDVIVFDLSDASDGESLSVTALMPVPIVALSPPLTNEGAARILRAGATCIITRPLSMEVLDAQLDALRRCREHMIRAVRHRYEYQGLALDFETGVVTLAGEMIHPSAIQYRILEFLCRNAGAIVTFNQVSDAAWGPGYYASHELIRSHVRNIRRLLRDSAANPRYIRTESQIGYWMPPPEPASARPMPTGVMPRTVSEQQRQQLRAEREKLRTNLVRLRDAASRLKLE